MKFSFENTGKKDIVVTLFDVSNNGVQDFKAPKGIKFDFENKGQDYKIFLQGLLTNPKKMMGIDIKVNDESLIKDKDFLVLGYRRITPPAFANDDDDPELKDKDEKTRAEIKAGRFVDDHVDDIRRYYPIYPWFAKIDKKPVVPIHIEHFEYALDMASFWEIKLVAGIKVDLEILQLYSIMAPEM